MSDSTRFLGLTKAQFVWALAMLFGIAALTYAATIAYFVTQNTKQTRFACANTTALYAVLDRVYTQTQTAINDGEYKQALIAGRISQKDYAAVFTFQALIRSQLGRLKGNTPCGVTE